MVSEKSKNFASRQENSNSTSKSVKGQGIVILFLLATTRFRKDFFLLFITKGNVLKKNDYFLINILAFFYLTTKWSVKIGLWSVKVRALVVSCYMWVA